VYVDMVRYGESAQQINLRATYTKPAYAGCDGESWINAECENE
jgi:hypothetical protein